ncbi:MAG: glycosyltransferase family 4 protein [Burkholderiales bacterium]
MDAGRNALKLIFAVDALSPALSGIGRYTWELTQRLAQSDSFSRVRYYRNEQWIKTPSALIGQSALRKKPLIRLPHWIKNWYWHRTCRDQIFHTPNYLLPRYAENGVITVHDLSVFKFPETHPVARLRQFEKSFQQSLNIATHLITDSEITRQEVIAYCGWPSARISAIHLGVAEVYAPRPAALLTPLLHRYGLSAGGYTLCVSTIEPRKRIDHLLIAYAQLPPKLRAAYPLVLIGGQGWQSDVLHEQIMTAQQAGWLHYLGFVNETDLPALYAGARLFIYPSIYEGFGLPVAEAMASGIPVIASNRSTLPEISAGAALLIDPDDIDAIATAIEFTLLDESWRKTHIAAGLNVAANYSWDICFQKTCQVYRSVKI